MLKKIVKLYRNRQWKKSNSIILNGHNFKRKFIEIVEIGSNWYIDPRYIFPVYDYYCPKCGSLLEDGPCGGASVNAVCHKCKLNYGCLPNRNE